MGRSQKEHRILQVLLTVAATIVYICMLIIGSLFHHSCPEQRVIPMYLVIGGVVGLVKIMLVVAMISKKPSNKLLFMCFMILVIFMVCWYCLGCYWIYPSLLPVIHQNGTEYCNKTLYYCSFTLVTLPMVSLGIGCFIFVCCQYWSKFQYRNI